MVERPFPPPGLDVGLLLRVQRDLAIALVGCDDLKECLGLLLAAALQLPGFDCGGTYLLDEETGNLHLTSHHGLSEAFVRQTSFYREDSPQAEFVATLSLFHGRLADLPPPIAAVLRSEGLCAIAVLPLICRNRLIGSLNLSTHHAAEIPEEGRLALESISALAQSAIAAIQAREFRLKAERQLTLAVQGANLGTWQADLDTRRIEASAQARELHGVPLDADLTVESAQAAFHPDDLQPFLIKVREAMAGEGSFALEYRNADGSRWIAAEARFFQDPSPRFYGIVRDVTSQKRLQQQLQASSQELEGIVAQRTSELAKQSATLRLALDGAGAGMRQVNLLTGQIEWDARGYDLVGYPEGEWVTTDRVLAERVHPDCQAALKNQLLVISMPGGADDWDHEYLINHPTRGERWVNSRGKVIRDANGLGTHLTGIILDITERKHAEMLLRQWNQELERRVDERTRELRESESRFKDLAEASFERIVFPENGIVLDLNPQAAAMFGYEPAEMLGRHVLDFTAPESFRIVSAQLSGNLTEAYEDVGLRKDGSTFHVESRARVELRDGRWIRVAALRDLTLVKQTTAQIEAQQAELERTRGLALISEISAGIIHQLSQPLSAAGANLAAAAATLTACQTQSCDSLVIIQEVMADLARMREIVIHLRNLASPRSLQRVATQLDQVVRNVLPLLLREADNRRVILETDLAPELPEIPIDSVQLKQVIINLVRNAFDACAELPPQQGTVTIATRNLPGQGLELTVRDNGTGLPPEIADRLFIPFVSTKPHGTGIGLRLCQTIVHAHHGSITGTNNPDNAGACFRIVLPFEPGST